MSHELEILENGQASMAYAGEEPWHGLGKKVPDDLSPEQMMEAAGLNWTVSKAKLRGENKGKAIKGLESYALVRDTDNQVLSLVSKSWNPCQNIDAFTFFNDFVGAGDMKMDTAGSLFDGRRVWALAKINDGFDLFGGDEIEGYFLFCNPHEFGKSIDIRLTAIRTVCSNTLSLALHLDTKLGIRINHRQPFNGDKVKEALGISHEKLQAYKERCAFIGKKKAKKEDIVDYFKRIFPVSGSKDMSRNATRALEILETQPGAEYAKGSLYQAFNAVTYLTNHELGRSEQNRVNSLWFGSNAELNLKALNLAVEMAG